MGNWNSWYCLAKIKVKAALVWYFVPPDFSDKQLPESNFQTNSNEVKHRDNFHKTLMQRSIGIIFIKLPGAG